MTYNPELITINTSHIEQPSPMSGIWENRLAAYKLYDGPGIPKCSIVVPAYNRVEKTKYCVECILKYTDGVSYELILIDNGSDDGTLEFFKSVEYNPKKIIHITKNIGAGYAWRVARDNFSGKYLVIVSNDVYVTKNWLSNLIKCYESDPRVGFVSPVSSAVSNYQQVNLEYQNFDEMQDKAETHNQSDPSKWDERLRLISLIGIYSRHVLDIVGISDPAFIHDFLEDDLAIRLRRGGYKLVLCRDTWVCHDHSYETMEAVERFKWNQIVGYGHAAYMEKYNGLNPWDDTTNFEFQLLDPISTMEFPDGKLKALTIDCRCGTPVLEVKNHLHRRGLIDLDNYAYTTKPQYYTDLQYIADTQCDSIDKILGHYKENTFDIIALCEPLDTYTSFVSILHNLIFILKTGGILLYKLNLEGSIKNIRLIKQKEGTIEN
ncbi:MAG: glycosyltransferase family 2 protein [Clostridiales bacterium]|jgi:GT2 family glycosyltransferase|nr:glycosyltransferase family 2 protein [Clostridiales bacterium]